MLDLTEGSFFGEPGIRDPHAFCEMFDPTPDIDWLGVWITAPGTGTCDSDGHYLCNGCRHLSKRGVEERQDRNT